MNCDKGHEAETVKPAIIDGRFGNYCPQHIKGSNRLASGQWAQWHRDRDYEDHRRDVIQAHDASGKPNPEFIKEYPEESAEIFTQEQINQAMRHV